MDSNKFYLTKEGHQNLLREYERLVREDKPAVLERVKKAREMGNLEDNQEYEAAREAQNQIENRIMEIEEILENVEFIEESTSVSISTGTIQLGSKVTVEVHGRQQTIKLVGTVEADPSQGLVSHESPVGQALLGLKEGDEVKIELPHATLVYNVVKVHI